MTEISEQQQRKLRYMAELDAELRVMALNDITAQYYRAKNQASSFQNALNLTSDTSYTQLVNDESNFAQKSEQEETDKGIANLQTLMSQAQAINIIVQLTDGGKTLEPLYLMNDSWVTLRAKLKQSYPKGASAQTIFVSIHKFLVDAYGNLALPAFSGNNEDQLAQKDIQTSNLAARSENNRLNAKADRTQAFQQYAATDTNHIAENRAVRWDVKQEQQQLKKEERAQRNADTELLKQQNKLLNIGTRIVQPFVGPINPNPAPKPPPQKPVVQTAPPPTPTAQPTTAPTTAPSSPQAAQTSTTPSTPMPNRSRSNSLASTASPSYDPLLATGNKQQLTDEIKRILTDNPSINRSDPAIAHLFTQQGPTTGNLKNTTKMNKNELQAGVQQLRAYIAPAPTSGTGFCRGRGLRTGSKGKKTPMQRKYIITGRGVTPSPSDDGGPSKFTVGKIFVDLKALNNGKLSARYHSSNLYKIKPTNISATGKIIVMEILSRDSFNRKLFATLEPSEKRTIEKFIHVIGKDESLSGYDGAQTTSDMFEMFQILRGEIQAGNNSIQVKTQLREIIGELVHNNRLSRSQGNSILMQIS